MSRRTLLKAGSCLNGHEIKSEADLYITPYNDKKQGQRVDVRCKACQQVRARNVVRTKLGIPLDAPVRKKKPEVPRPKAVRELSKLVANNAELAEYLLKIAQYEQLARELGQN